MSGTKENPSDRQGLQCKATKKDGSRCTAFAVTADGFCIGHSPGAAKARAKGGKMSSKAARLDKLIPTRLKPTLNLIETAINEVHEGRLEPRIGTAMASLASAMVKVLESGIMEERLSILEQRMKEAKWV